jgi:hypothetical protein
MFALEFIQTTSWEDLMKKVLIAFAVLGAATAFAAKVQDWKDLDKVHKHVQEAMNEMNRARAANHYDMAGHGAKAEDLLKQAEQELAQAVEAAKTAK